MNLGKWAEDDERLRNVIDLEVQKLLEHSGKKGNGGNGKLFGKSDDIKVEIVALELLMDPKTRKFVRDISWRMQKEEAAGSLSFSAQKRKLTTWWQAEIVGWRTKERG